MERDTGFFVNGAEIEPVDIIIGGSPCQDISVAGKRAGSEEIMKRFTKLLRIEYEDKWVVEDAFEDESGLIRGKAIDCLAQYETANEGLGCEECFGVAGMEIPLSTGIKSVNFCPICGRRF